MATSTQTKNYNDYALEDFRAVLRTFFESNHPGRPSREPGAKVAFTKNWLATLYDAGFSGPSFPQEVGGMDLDFEHQVVYQEELARAKVPGPQGTGLGIVAPAIVKYGTAEEKQQYVVPMLRGDQVWVQGFSEPDAGSDLQSLRTTARRDGDFYVVNGQKVWTSSGTIGDMIFALVRTGTPQSKQKGISYLFIDADAPGIEIRPLREITGGTGFAEVFFDNVRVPVSRRFGEENGAWPLVRTSLGHERAAGAMNQAAMYRRVLDELEQLAGELGRFDDELIVDRFADFEIRVRIMRHNAQRVIADIINKGEPGPTSSISRMLITGFEQDLHEFALELLGPTGLITKESDRAVQRARWLTGFLRTRASTIGAGTSEIQRNTVAEQVLKLPYDPTMPAR